MTPRKAVGSMLLCMLAMSCQRPEREVNLGDGYKYVELDHVVNAAIVDREDHIVVDPNVKRFKVLGAFVVGERANANIDDKLSRRFGYFIFDKRNGTLLEGLDNAAFSAALRDRGLRSSPLE
jgi:hypothetical protein